jgi:hypothetical protein
MVYCAISFAAGVAATFVGLLALVVIVGGIDAPSETFGGGKRPQQKGNP